MAASSAHTSGRSWRMVSVLMTIVSGCCDSSGDTPSADVTFRNDTPYVLHFLHPQGNLLYVAPYTEASVEVDSVDEVNVLVAPGQAVTGIVKEYADCCFTDNGSDCATITAKWQAGELFTESSGPFCPDSGSCPYVYAGHKEHLVGEALVGALNRGAARDDVMVLPDLEAHDGQYRVRIAAELDETEYIDFASLQLVEHDATAQVMPDSNGALHIAHASTAPLSARDSAFRDLQAVLRAGDETYWEGRQLRQRVGDKIRDWVTLSFARPKAARRATLLIRGRNTQFLQHAYHNYMRQFGPGLPKIMRALTGLPGYGSTLSSYVSSSGFSLEVDMERGNTWQPVGLVEPVGPAGDKVIALPLNLPPAGSDQVRVRVAMLPGAWQVDSIGMSFDDQLVHPIHGLVPRAVQRRHQRVAGEDTEARSALIRQDEQHVRVNTGESLELFFDALAQPAGRKHTAVLRLSGYYEENDESPKPCVAWRRLFSASLADNAFAKHVLKRLEHEDAVDRLAREAGVRRPP